MELADRIAGLRPLPAWDNLILCTALYIRWREPCYVNYMEGGFALFDNWYIQQSVINKDETKSYYTQSYPDVCLCGVIYKYEGSTLREHCRICQGNPNLQLLSMYEISRIARYLNINHYYYESIVASTIYHGNFTRKISRD